MSDSVGASGVASSFELLAADGTTGGRGSSAIYPARCKVISIRFNSAWAWSTAFPLSSRLPTSCRIGSTSGEICSMCANNRHGSRARLERLAGGDCTNFSNCSRVQYCTPSRRFGIFFFSCFFAFSKPASLVSAGIWSNFSCHFSNLTSSSCARRRRTLGCRIGVGRHARTSDEPNWARSVSICPADLSKWSAGPHCGQEG